MILQRDTTRFPTAAALVAGAVLAAIMLTPPTAAMLHCIVLFSLIARLTVLTQVILARALCVSNYTLPHTWARIETTLP